MRISILYVSIFLIWSYNISSMDSNRNERSVMGSVYHWLEKKRKPIQYITDSSSIELCNKVLRFHPDHEHHLPVTLDNTCLEDIHRIFDREKALLTCTEYYMCTEVDPSTIERIAATQKKENGLYSPLIKAVINGFLETYAKITEDTLAKLKSHSSKNSENEVLQNRVTQSPENDRQEKNFLSIKTLEDLIVHDNATWSDKLMNYLRKTLFAPNNYLTDDTAHRLCEAALHFDPTHQFHNSDWQLNQTLPLHTTLIKRTFERQWRLLDNLEAAIKNQDTNNVMQLNPNNPKEAVPDGYFSPVAKAIVAGYLKKMTKLTEQHTNIRKESLQAHNISAITEKNIPTNEQKSVLPPSTPPIEITNGLIVTDDNKKISVHAPRDEAALQLNSVAPIVALETEKSETQFSMDDLKQHQEKPKNSSSENIAKASPKQKIKKSW